LLRGTIQLFQEIHPAIWRGAVERLFVGRLLERKHEVHAKATPAVRAQIGQDRLDVGFPFRNRSVQLDVEHAAGKGIIGGVPALRTDRERCRRVMFLAKLCGLDHRRRNIDTVIRTGAEGGA